MEIAGTAIFGCFSLGNAALTYKLSRRLKSDKEKIKQGGEQLNRLLKEYDSHIKYIYNLRVVCNDYKLALEDMYNRQFLKTNEDITVRNQYVFLRNKINDELFVKINEHIESWKSLDEEFLEIKTGEECRLKIIENLLQKNKIDYEVIKGCQSFDDDCLLFLVYAFLSIIGFLQIRKKSEDNIHASFSIENDNLHSLLSKAEKLLNINNNDEISVPINLQNCLGEKMLQKVNNNDYKVISYLDFKDKVNNTYLKKQINLSNVVTFNYLDKLEENLKKNKYKIWIIQNKDIYNKWLEEEFSIIKYFDNKFFKNFKKICTDCYKLQEFFSVKNERENKEEKKWTNIFICLMYLTILSIYSKDYKKEIFSELEKIFVEFIEFVNSEAKLDFSISKFSKFENTLQQKVPEWSKFVEKKIRLSDDITKSKFDNFIINNSEYKFFKEITILNYNFLNPNSPNIHLILYDDVLKFKKEISSDYDFEDNIYVISENKTNRNIVDITKNLQFTGEKKTNNYNSSRTCQVFIYDNIIKLVNNNEHKIIFLDQKGLSVIETNGYLKIYRGGNKNLIFIKTSSLNSCLIPGKGDKIYTRDYLLLRPTNEIKLDLLKEYLIGKIEKYRNIRENDLVEISNDKDLNCIQYLDDPYNDEEKFLKMKQKILEKKDYEITFILKGIKSNFLRPDDREIFEFFKNTFYEYLIKDEHRIFKQIGDICCDLNKESKKLIKKDIESRKNLLNKP